MKTEETKEENEWLITKNLSQHVSKTAPFKKGDTNWRLKHTINIVFIL